MATYSSILAWEFPWTEEPGGPQSMGSQRVRYNLATKQQKSIQICDLILPHYTSGKNKIGVFPNYR